MSLRLFLVTLLRVTENNISNGGIHYVTERKADPGAESKA